MITDKTLDEALVELLRTKRALEALRTKRKAAHKECWIPTCSNSRRPTGLDFEVCPTCGGRLFLYAEDRQEHAAAKRATLDLTRKLADLRAGR